MDLLRTRAREQAFLELCLRSQQRFVVDNTNPTAADRRRYVATARAAGFDVIGYLVEVDAAEALARNDARDAKRRVPASASWGTARRFVRPTPRASTSSGTPPRRPAAAGASSRS